MAFTSSGQVENFGTGMIGALNGAVTLTIPTSSSAAFQITGTWVATLIFEATVDGTNWFTINATTMPAGASVSTTTANNAFLAGVGGFQGFRVRASAYTSGTVAMAWTADNTPNIQSTVQQGNAPWMFSLPSGASTSALQTQPGVDIGDVTVNNAPGASAVNIQDGGNSITVDGAVTAAAGEGTKTTYSSAIITLNLAALATDFFTITGSATKTVRVTEIFVVFTGGGVIITAQLLKRSTANTGGTSSSPSMVPHDSNSGAATAAIRAYTVNPTVLGTLVGLMRAERTNSPLLTSTTNPEDISYSFGTRPSQTVVLRGTGEVLAFNLNGVTLSSGTATAFIEWTEE